MSVAMTIIGLASSVFGVVRLVGSMRSSAPSVTQSDGTSVSSGTSSGIRALTPNRATASSVLSDYRPVLAIDGDRSTAWCVSGDGTGETIRYVFDAPVSVKAIGIDAGYDKVDPATGDDRWAQNRRPASFNITFSAGDSWAFQVEDERGLQSAAFPEVHGTNFVELQITGTVGSGDTCVSELAVFGFSS
jgi:hypothetical protein